RDGPGGVDGCRQPAEVVVGVEDRTLARCARDGPGDEGARGARADQSDDEQDAQQRTTRPPQHTPPDVICRPKGAKPTVRRWEQEGEQSAQSDPWFVLLRTPSAPGRARK